MIECMENFNIKWKEEHLNENLINFRTGVEHNIQYAVSRILECVDEWSEKVLILMHYIPDDNNSEFQKKREMIYEICSFIFKDKMSKKKMEQNFQKKYGIKLIIWYLIK